MGLLLATVLILICIIYISSLNWRRSVYTVFVLVVLEGALRKWALPQASQFLYFLKDFVLIGAYLSYFGSNSKPQILTRNRTILALIGLVFAWGIFQVFNPSLGSPIIGLLGLKNYFLYIPLMWLLPSLFRSQEEFYRFLRTYLLLLIPVGLLAIAQFYSPPSSPLNVYAWGEDGPGVVLNGDRNSVRVTGTFSYIAGYSVYLLTCLTLLLPMLSLKQPQLWRWLTIVEILLVAVTAFMTGARSLILGSALLVVGYFGIQALTNFSGFYRSFRSFLLPSLIAFAVVTLGFRSAVNALWLRVTKNQDLSGRITGSFLDVFRNLQYKHLDGYGLGATFQGNGILRRLLDLPPGETIAVYYEGEMGRIVLELGPFGFVLWYGLKLLLLLALGRAYWQLKNPFLRQLALSAFLLQAITFNGQLVYNHTAGFYHWFFNGFILLLPQLEIITQWQQHQQQLQHYAQSLRFSSSSDQ